MSRKRSLVSGLGTNDMPIGWLAESQTNIKIYYLWKAMLRRATKQFWAKYPSYAGTTVSAEWLVLSNFARDISQIEGYQQWLIADKCSMMLDKDTKVPGNKHYSKETCRFITHTESNREVMARHPDNCQHASQQSALNNSIPVIAICLQTGHEYVFASIKDAATSLGLNGKTISKILSDKYPQNKTTGGYTFKRLNQMPL